MARQAPTQEIVVRQSFALPGAILLLALLLAVAAWRFAAPAPVPAATAGEGFSAERAREVLAELAGDGTPHPTGSAANAAVRDRIQAILRRNGLEPEVQAATGCVGTRCARVENVLARLPGRAGEGAVLLMAHYDSVGAGVGAGDDLAGVAAALEVARLLKAGPPLAHEVLVLLDDGEELGLLGARAFADGHPAAKGVRAVVNLEARGTAGPSMMFETSGLSDRWLASLYGGAVSAPVSSSLFAAIYDRMPNDTDLTVWKERGVPGLNFAFIGNPLHYHTARDEVARLSLASLQHHGDNALGSVRALAGAGELASPPQGEGYWFDLWRLFLVRWGGFGHGVLTALAALLPLAVIAVALKKGTVRAGALGRGLLFVPAALVLTAVVTFVLFKVVQGAAFPAPWVAHPGIAQVTFWMHGLLAVMALGLLFSRRASFAGLWIGVWTWWAVFAVLLSVFATGLAYLFQLPAIAAAAAGLALFRKPDPWAASGAVALFPLAVAGLVWWPVLLPLYDGLGGSILPLVAILVALVTTGLAPFVVETARRTRLLLFFAILAVSLGTAVGAALVAPFSEDAPQPVNLQLHVDADSGKNRWLVRGNPLPAGLAQAAAFQLGAAFPWSPSYLGAHAAPAPAVSLPAPEVTVVADEKGAASRRLRLRLRSLRGARIGVLAVPAALKVESVTLDGKPLTLPPQAQGYHIFSTSTLPAEGSEIELVVAGGDPIELYAADQSAGLPPEGKALLAARGKLAVPFQDGDTTVVSRKLAF